MKKSYKKYQEDWRKRHPFYHRNYNKKYYKKNKIYYSNKGKLYRENHKYYLKRLNSKYKKEHKEEISNYNKEYNDEHKKEIKIKNEKWREKNKQRRRLYANSYVKNKWKTDNNFVIRYCLRTSLRNALNKYGNGKKYSSKKYGIDFSKIIEHLKPFPENRSKYHIDHIRPLCSFTFVNEDGTENIEQIQEAFRPENHQWLLAEENLIKNKYF